MIPKPKAESGKRQRVWEPRKTLKTRKRVRKRTTDNRQLTPMSNHRKTTICRETWYYLVVLGIVLGGAMLREVNLLFVLAGMLVGPLVLSWRWVAMSLRDLKIDRNLPRGVCAGDLLVVNLELANTRRRRGSWAVVVEDRIEGPNEQAIGPSVYFPHVPAGGSCEGVYRGRLPRRGRYVVGPFRVSTRFPFGLLRRTITLGEPETLVVFPRLGRLAESWLTRHHQAFEGSHRRRQRYSRVEGEFYGVREWRDGDSRRSIHWRSSARRGGLVVRQYDQPHNRDVAVLVDLWQPEEPEAEDLDHVELAVSFAATVVSDLCRKGGANLLIATTAAPADRTAGPASMAMMQDAMRHLALAEAEADDRLPELLEQTLGEIEPGTDIILVGTRRVDLSDPDRFGPLRQDPTRSPLLHYIREVDTSNSELSQYFQPE